MTSHLKFDIKEPVDYYAICNQPFSSQTSKKERVSEPMSSVAASYFFFQTFWYVYKLDVSFHTNHFIFHEKK